MRGVSAGKRTEALPVEGRMIKGGIEFIAGADPAGLFVAEEVGMELAMETAV